MKLEAVEAMEREFGPDRVFVGSGGDNLAASFSSELVHASICVTDVAGGDKVPRKGGPGVTRSELLDEWWVHEAVEHRHWTAATSTARPGHHEHPRTC